MALDGTRGWPRTNDAEELARVLPYTSIVESANAESRAWN
jgi:hypothetical protein